MISQNLPDPLLNKIVRRIHGEPELDGCMIGYAHMGHQRLLHKGLIPTRNMLEKFVMVEHVGLPPGTTAAAAKGAVPSNISRFGPEIIGVGCSLMCFAFSVGALTTGAALTPETGPVGALVAVAGWTGIVTAGIQTYNGAPVSGKSPSIPMAMNSRTGTRRKSTRTRSRSWIFLDASLPSRRWAPRFRRSTKFSRRAARCMASRPRC